MGRKIPTATTSIMTYCDGRTCILTKHDFATVERERERERETVIQSVVFWVLSGRDGDGKSQMMTERVRH